MKAIINNKEYDLKEARTSEEQQKGLSGVTELADGEGMIFIYPEEKQVNFWMHDTPLPLDIIGLDDDFEVKYVTEGQPNDDTPIPMTVKYVIEIAAGSGVKVGDEIDLELDDEDTSINSKMLVLDEEGNVQMELSGGERIFSRIATRKFIRLAVKAWKNKQDESVFNKYCKKLGKALFDELTAQDNRDPEYVELHKSKESSEDEND